MINWEKGAVPQENNFNLMLNQKKRRRETNKAVRKKEKQAQKSKGNEKAQPEPEQLDKSDETEPLNPPCHDKQFNHWLKTGAKSDWKCESSMIICPDICYLPENYRFHSHTSLHVRWWRMDSHHRGRIWWGDWWSNPSTWQGMIRGQMLGTAFRKAKGRTDEGEKERQHCHHYCRPSEP